jgi:hypothetical protein
MLMTCILKPLVFRQPTIQVTLPLIPWFRQPRNHMNLPLVVSIVQLRYVL